METKQIDESTAKSMQSDATMIDAYIKDMKELTRKIEAHASKLSGGGENCLKNLQTLNWMCVAYY